MSQYLHNAGRFRQRLQKHEPLLGTIVTLSAPEVAEIASSAGFDWLFVDAEHSPLDFIGVQRMLQAAAPDCACLVRVAGNDEVLIKKALDTGPDGIIVPQVNTAQDAQRVVKAARYYPEGERSVGVGRAQGYGLELQTYLAGANDALSVVVQIEHIEAVGNIEAIVETPGIDALFIGPYDLSASMGKPGSVDDTEVRAAMQRVLDCCADKGKPLGVFGAGVEAVQPFMRAGYSLVAVGIDVLVLGQAMQGIVGQLRKVR